MSPGGGAFHRCEGRLRSGAPPPPTAWPLGGTFGSATHVLCARVCGCGGPTLSAWPACPVGAACRGGGGGPSPRGVACQRCKGRLVSGAVPPPAARPLGRAAGAPRPVCPRCGRCGCGDPAPAPKGAPLRASVARRGGGGRASLGGVRRSPSPGCPPSGRAVGAHYPLAVGAGGCRRGGPSPTPQHALLRAGFARCGGCTRAPGGGASCLGVGRPGSGALPPPTARPLGGLPGPTTHWLWVRGVAGVGTRHQPHSARSCVLWGRHEGARGGRLLPWCGASGVGRSRSRDCPPSGRAAGAHYPLAVGAGGCGRGDPSPTPQRALLRAGFARCGGGTRAPGGGVSCLGVGRPGSGALPPPTARPLGGLPGPTTHWLWVRGVAGVGTRHQPHSARSCVLWGRHDGARGGRLLPGCGASGVGRSPTPDCPPSGRAAEAHYPLALGAGGCGRGGPSPTPQRAHFRAGFARCGGGMRVPGWGASCLGVGRPGSGALRAPTARPLGGLPGPTTHWLWVREGAGVGTRQQPHSARSCELALRAVGAARGRQGARGASCLGVGRPGSGALPPPTARPLGGLPGRTTHWLWVRGDAGVGTRHQPHSARSCVLSGRHEGARGGRLSPGRGASGVGRSPTPDCPPSGRAAGAHYPLAVGAGGCGRGDPSPTPQRALLRAGFARCGGGTRAPGGGASCLGVGRPGSGALPPPTARPLGGLPGPTTHWLWVPGGSGVGTCHQPHSARSCVLWGRHEGARGGRLLPWCGASGVGRSPNPDCPPSGRAPGAHYLLAVGAGGCGRGDPSPTPQRALLRAGFARCGGGMRVPGGGACCLGVGRPGSGALPPPTARPLGGLPGPTTHWLWVRGAAGVATRHQPHSARWGLRAGFARCGGGRRAPGGGASCLGVGRPGSGALPTPTARPLGGLPGPTTHWLWVRGGAGVGTRHQPHSARSCVLWGRHGGARGGRLLPGCGASGVGRSPTPDCPPSGRAAGAHYPLAVGAGGCERGDPSPTPQRALASWLCALWGLQKGARGGRVLPGCGASGVGRSPTPDCPLSGRAAGAQ